MSFLVYLILSFCIRLASPFLPQILCFQNTQLAHLLSSLARHGRDHRPNLFIKGVGDKFHSVMTGYVCFHTYFWFLVYVITTYLCELECLQLSTVGRQGMLLYARGGVDATCDRDCAMIRPTVRPTNRPTAQTREELA